MTFDFRNHLTTKALEVHSLVKAIKEKKIPSFQRMWYYQPVTLTSSLSIYCILTLLGTFSSSYSYSSYSYSRHVLTALLTTFLVSHRSSAVASFAWTAATVSASSASGSLFRKTTSDQSTNRIQHTPTVIVESPKTSHALIHFIFLVHGFKGMSADLSYVQQNLKSVIEQRVFDGKSDVSTSSKKQSCKVVIHNSMANEYKTKDGIESGGDRLFEEMLQVIRTHVHLANQQGTMNSTNTTHITLSLIGNSLGGIYSRYAVAKLAAMSNLSNNSTNTSTSTNLNMTKDSFLIDNDAIHIHFNVFCTTATPHLGIARHTWFKIPRIIEVSIANLLGDTGKDLFLMTDIMKKMTTPEYLRPLATFRKRILYANAFHTDFVVPCKTASFLHENSNYPHYFTTENDVDNIRYKKGYFDAGEALDESSSSSSNQDVSESITRLFVTTLHTLPTASNSYLENSTSHDTSNPTESSKPRREAKKTQTWEWKIYESVHEDVLLEMSQSLDSLGWKKVFIDVREEIPIPIRLPIPNITKSSRNILGKSIHATNMIFHRQKDVYESRDIAHALSLPDKFMAFPIGHNMMVAFSRTPFTSYFYRGGRPIVDQLVSDPFLSVYSILF